MDIRALNTIRRHKFNIWLKKPDLVCLNDQLLWMVLEGWRHEVKLLWKSSPWSCQNKKINIISLFQIHFIPIWIVSSNSFISFILSPFLFALFLMRCNRSFFFFHWYEVGYSLSASFSCVLRISVGLFLCNRHSGFLSNPNNSIRAWNKFKIRAKRSHLKL